MHTSVNVHGLIASAPSGRWLRIAPITALLASLNSELPSPLPSSGGTADSCGVSFNPNATYPPLPEVKGPDVSGEPGVLIHLQPGRGVVELEDCLYELDRPLEVDFTGLNHVELLFDVSGASYGARMFVSDASGVFESFEVYDGVFAYMMVAEGPLGFEVAPLTQMAPTVPIVVTRPREDDPEPT